MTDAGPNPAAGRVDDAPGPASEPIITPRRRFPSIVWLVPLVALLVGVSMLAEAWISQGPAITIGFRTASGIEVGKTPVKYKDVTVGVVSSVELAGDGTGVLVTTELDKSAESLAHRDTRFWVVRPRISAGGVSGLDTLLSGAYIGVDTGTSGEIRHNFTGLETPPTVISGTPGRSFRLRASDLGSIDVGSPIYYRRVQVGRVASYSLDPDGQHISASIFIDAPYDALVRKNSRFWNASGIDVSLSAEGLKLRTQSAATIIAGGIAFGDPTETTDTPVEENAGFDLQDDMKTAMAAADGPGQLLQLTFAQPLEGLSVGAVVKFAGVDLGRVVSLDLDYQKDNQVFPTVVGIEIFPQRLQRMNGQMPDAITSEGIFSPALLDRLVKLGLRAQPKSGNLLTGQLYIALNIVPKAKTVDYDPSTKPQTLPTIPGDFAALQEHLSSVAEKIDQLPLASIAGNLDQTLASLHVAVGHIDTALVPEATGAMQQAQQTLRSVRGVTSINGSITLGLQATMTEVQRTLFSIRAVTDVLGRHPEAIIRGVQK